MKKFYVTGLTIAVSALFALSAHAEQPPQIYLSEINWAGSSLSTADEWIELFNPNGQSVDVSGWILTGSATSGDALALSDGTVIEANSTLLIANYNLGNAKTTLGVEPDLTTSALSLPNSDLDILLTTPLGVVVDEVHVSGRPDVGSTEPYTSMERDFQDNLWQSATANQNLLDASQLGTPGLVMTEAIDTPPNTEEPDETIDESETPDDSTEMCFCPCAVDSGTTEEDVVEETGTVEETDSEVTDTAPVDDSTTPISEVEETEDETTDPVPMSFINHALLLNELVSDPVDTIEWVELYNPGIATISLEGWQLVDASGKTTALLGAIEAGGYSVVENPAGKLNNTGDTVNLLDPSGNTIDSVEYGVDPVAPKKGESLARDENLGWRITTTPTRNEENQINDPYATNNETEEVETSVSQDSLLDSGETETTVSNNSTDEENAADLSTVFEPFRVVAIAQAAELQEETTSTAKTKSTDSQTTTLSGVITAAPDIFGSQVAYIPGAQLYFYYADWPLLAFGDTVEITGELTESRGETRFKIASAEDIEVTGHLELSPVTITTAELLTTPEGTLVKINGTVVARENDELTIRDSSGDATVIANSRTGMTWTQINSTQVSITGVVRHLNDNTRLYPRTMADIEEEVVSPTDSSAQLSSSIVKHANWKPWLGGTIAILALFAATIWYLQYKRLQPLTQTN